MGKRYRNSLSKVKDIITYHIYDDGVKVAEFVGDKLGARAYADNLNKITTEIRKTRVQVPVDKQD